MGSTGSKVPTCDISAVGTDNFVILAPHPSLLPPPRAGVGIHQHNKQLFVQGRPECTFITSNLCFAFLWKYAYCTAWLSKNNLGTVPGVYSSYIRHKKQYS